MENSVLIWFLKMDSSMLLKDCKINLNTQQLNGLTPHFGKIDKNACTVIRYSKVVSNDLDAVTIFEFCNFARRLVRDHLLTNFALRLLKICLTDVR